MGSETQLRVLHVIPSVAPRYGGPSLAVVQMCRALRGVGVDPLIATTDADGPGRLPVPLARVTDYQGVPVIFFSRQWTESFKYSAPLSAWLRKHVAEFDLVHIHAVFSHACLAAASACRRWSVPYLVRPLGTLDPWSLRQKRLRKWLLWHAWVEGMLRAAAVIHYTSEEERRLSEGLLGLDRGAVIPLGVDDVLLSDPPPQHFRGRHPELGEAPYVLLLSRLHFKKGVELLLRAYLDLVREPEFAHWHLVIAGDGDAAYVQSLERLAARDGRGGSVLFTGWLAGSEKTAALRGAALFVLPSRQENFGLAAVEAMVCGVPVLVSSQVNLAEEIKVAGAGWVAALERRALAVALAEALSDEVERHRRGGEGRQLVLRRFTWPTVVRELMALYRTVSLRGREGAQ